jgi:HEPN domain-containing protein
MGQVVSRAKDWLKQAQRDLAHARRAQEIGHFDWACFAAHQAAEKAVKALYQSAGGDARGHSVWGLLDQLPAPLRPPDDLVEAGRRLDRHYIPTRYPHAFPGGAPCERYAAPEAEEAIRDAERIVAFCTGHLA